MTGALARFLGLHVVLSLAIAALVWWGGPWLAGLVYHRPDVGHYARWLALPLVLEAPFLLVSVVLQASRRMRALVVIEAARAAALLVVTLIALAVAPTAWNVVLASIATSAITLAATIVGYGRLRGTLAALPAWRTLAARMPRERFGATLRTGGLIALDKQAGSLAAQLPVLLLGAVDTTAVAHYAAAVRAMAVPAPLLTGLARSLDTTLALRASAGSRAVVSAWRQATWRAALAWIPVAAATGLVAVLALVPVLGPGYAPGREAILPLVVHSLVLGVGVGLGPAFRAMDVIGRSLAIGLVTLAVTLVPGLWMVGAWGVTGAAWFHALRTAVATGAGLVVVARLGGPGAAADDAQEAPHENKEHRARPGAGS